MSQALIQGNFSGKAVKADLSTNKKGQVELKIDFEIVGGEHNGRRLPYSGLFTEKAIKYTKRAMIELGASGKDAAAAPAEIMAAAKVVPIEVTVASWKKDDGSVSEWSTVRNVGTYQPPIVPPDRSQISDVNKWLAEADTDSTIPF